MKRVTLNLHVRKTFLPLFQADTPRFCVVIAHRRCGKTVAAVQRMIDVATRGVKPNTRAIYLAPQRNQAKAVAWDLAKNMTKNIPGRSVNEAELRIDLHNGARMLLSGADNPDALRGQYGDLVIMDEVDQMPPGTWTYVVRPLLADRQGSAMFIGTPQGKQSLYELWDAAPGLDGWGRFMFKASETGLVPQSELDMALREMGQEAYDQEFECSFTAAIKGAFYGKLMTQLEEAGHMLPIDRDPSVPLTTGWDLGTRDATAIWVMQPYGGNGWAALDFYENSGEGIDHYSGWLSDHGYLAGARHIAPHDIANTDFGIAGGHSRRDVAEQYGIRFERAVRPQNAKEVMDGINAVRMLLPRMYFHAGADERGSRVAAGRHALGLYRQGFNERLSALQANPVHDWTSHAADAMRTFASMRETLSRSPIPGHSQVNPNLIVHGRSRQSARAGRLGPRV